MSTTSHDVQAVDLGNSSGISEKMHTASTADIIIVDAAIDNIAHDEVPSAKDNGVQISTNTRKRSSQSHHSSNKKRKSGRCVSGNDGVNSNAKLNESTTIDDLTAIDASTYLAWVAQQADKLPSVFVAPATVSASNHNNETSVSARKDAEEPIDGSMATLQVLLSNQMEILPPPSLNHLPPLNTSGSNNDTTPHSSTFIINGNNSSHNCSNWVSSTVSNFSKLRSYLEQEQAKQQKNNRRQQNRKIAVPRMKDCAAWHVFCLGKEEAHGNVGGYFEDFDHSDAENSDDDNNDGANDEAISDKNCNANNIVSTGVNINGSSNHDTGDVGVNNDISRDGDAKSNFTYNPHLVPQKGYQPTTSILLQLDQVLTRTIFHHHVHFLCEWKFPLTHQRAAWIYAILARMEKPWHREECCAVRSILRECCARRWKLVLPSPMPSQKRDAKLEVDNTKSKSQSSHFGQKNNSSNEKTETGEESSLEQLALLNTMIAITGIYYEQGAIAGGDGMDSLFTVAIGKT